ncbi:DUF4267 domain-containing protein [Pedobacter lusitanus]|uniref:DUF4267 domain-containing protein n=1 Tax=Pedobacter lusitanus TaxID=1503925 RepID=UPI0006983E19|nr:DUF4267 domain-containing protein [Pedobacter lusitanus]
MTTKVSYSIAFLTGLGLIFIGARFFLSPEVAEAGFGIHFNEQGNYSFHYIKGIRDIFSGLLICLFVLMNEKRALGVTLLAGTMVPISDMLIVLSKNYNGFVQAVPHILAIIICLISGIILLASTQTKKHTIRTRGYIKLTHSAATNKKK